MTNEQAYRVLENCASLLDSGTRFFPENHVREFHEAYELAMEALRKTERKRGCWVGIDDEPYETYECDVCGAVYDTVGNTWDLPNYCPNCGAKMTEG